MDQQKKTDKTCGVWTNTASSLVPRVEIEQSRAGYLKMVGCLKNAHDNKMIIMTIMIMIMMMLQMVECLTKAQAMAKEVPTPSTVSRRRERMLT